MAKKIILPLLPLLVFVLFTIVLFRPYIFGGKVPIPGDILIGHYHPWVDKIWEGRTAGYPIKNFILFDGIRQILPWRLLAMEQFKAGRLPLWNPYILSGMPLLGNFQAAALYPLNVLFFILPELDAWTIYILFQPILAGLFTYFFLRTISCSRKASLLGGICYGFSLIMMNHLEFGIDGHTALWLPLGLGAINRIQQSQKWRWGLVLTISVGMSLLGGYPPPAIYNLIILFIYSLYKIRPLISRKILICVFGVVFAFLLAAPQILPALELAKKVVREETQFGFLSGETYFFPFENLIMLIAPDFFGHPSTGNFFSRIYYTDNPSVGIIGFLFVIYSLGWILKKKEVSFWLFFGIFPMLLVLETPLGQALRHLPIPAFSLVTPIRMIWVVAFSLSVLVGIGMEVVSVLIQKKQFWQIFLPIILLWEILFLVWVASFLIPEGEHIQVAQRNLILPTFFLSAGSFVLLLSLFFPKFWPIFASLIVLLAGTELVRQGIKYNPFISKDLVFPETKILREIQKGGEQWRTIVTHQELLPVNSNTPYHIPMIDGYAPIYDGRYGQLIRLVNAQKPLKKIEGYPRIVFQTKYDSPITDLLNVKWILALEELDNSKLSLVIQEGETRLYENLEVGPKSFFAQNYWVGQGDLEVANKMLTIDLAKEVVLEKEPGIEIRGEENGEAEVVDYKKSSLVVRTNNKNPGILVLSDSFDFGWKAYVDGKKTEILRADYALRAVVVPAGKHTVEFIYDPFSFKIGLYLSSGTLILLIVGGIGTRHLEEKRC